MRIKKEPVKPALRVMINLMLATMKHTARIINRKIDSLIFG
jgi:hypothetical protein